MQLLVMVIAAAAVFLAALIGELENFSTHSVSAVSQATSTKVVVEQVDAAKNSIEKLKMQTPIKDLTLQDPSEACRDRAKDLAKNRGRAKYAWAETVKVASTRKIKTVHGNPAFLVNIKADSERTYCAVIFQNSTCKVDMMNCSEEPKRLQLARFGTLAAK